MSCIDDTAWIDERIAKTRALIAAYEDALLALSTGAQSYSLDTGQTRQTVTKSGVGELRNALSMLENRLGILCARRHPGSGSYYGRPGF